jgi:hypothetical protein
MKTNSVFYFIIYAMRRYILVLTTLLPWVLYGQKIATTFQDAVEKGVSIEKLDESYMSAIHSDSTKAAFNGQEKQFIDGYVSLLSDLSTYLKQHNFKWEKATRCFNRIYFNKNGGIDYFLFNFKDGEIDRKKESEFKTLLGLFIQTYKFPLSSNVNFAQCSPVSYVDK